MATKISCLLFLSANSVAAESPWFLLPQALAEKVRRISLLSLRSEVGHTMALTKGSLLKVASRYSGTSNNQRSFQSRAADSEIHSMEQRFAEIHEQILRAERDVNITVDKMATDMSLMQDLVQASMEHWLADEGDMQTKVCIVCASSRFIVTKTHAHLCSEWFRAASDGGMKESRLGEIHLREVDDATFSILRLCMSLGPLRIGSIDLLQVSLESTAMLHAIALAHRLLMPWMAHRLADKFARQFALGRANSQVDDVDAVLPVAFAALALAALVHAASVTDAVGGAASAADAGASAEEEGGVWARVVRLLKGSAMAFLARHIEAAWRHSAFRELDARVLCELLLVVEDAAWGGWREHVVPQGAAESWTGPLACGTLKSPAGGWDFMLQVTNLCGAGAVGAYVYLANGNVDTFAAAPAAHTRGSSSCEHDDKSFCDEENSFRDEQNSFRDEQTSFCSRALFRFEVAAEPAEASTRAHGRTTYWPAGREQGRRFDGARGQAQLLLRYGETAEVSDGFGWGWGAFIAGEERGAFVHEDGGGGGLSCGVGVTLWGGGHFRLAFRASLLQLHRQTFALTQYVQAVAGQGMAQGALFASTFDFCRRVEGSHGAALRGILTDYVARAFQPVILSSPAAFLSMTEPEITEILIKIHLRQTHANWKAGRHAPPVHAAEAAAACAAASAAALWILSAYRALRELADLEMHTPSEAAAEERRDTELKEAGKAMLEQDERERERERERKDGEEEASEKNKPEDETAAKKKGTKEPKAEEERRAQEAAAEEETRKAADAADAVARAALDLKMHVPPDLKNPKAAEAVARASLDLKMDVPGDLKMQVAVVELKSERAGLLLRKNKLQLHRQEEEQGSACFTSSDCVTWCRSRSKGAVAEKLQKEEAEAEQGAWFARVESRYCRDLRQ